MPTKRLGKWRWRYKNRFPRDLPRVKRFWRVPQMWPDAECYIIGGGPSLLATDLSVLEGNGAKIIAVNHAFTRIRSDVVFSGCRNWLRAHAWVLSQLDAYVITTCPYDTGLDFVKVARHRTRPLGLSRNEKWLLWNFSSGACAVDLAVHLGAKKIVLFGFDMRKIAGRTNWHTEHKTSIDDKYNPYDRFLLPWPSIARDAKSRGIEILNATPGSALRAFPVISPQEVLCESN